MFFMCGCVLLDGGVFVVCFVWWLMFQVQPFPLVNFNLSMPLPSSPMSWLDIGGKISCLCELLFHISFQRLCIEAHRFRV